VVLGAELSTGLDDISVTDGIVLIITACNLACYSRAIY